MRGQTIDLKYLRLKVCSNGYLGGHALKICNVDCVHKAIKQVYVNITFSKVTGLIPLVIEIKLKFIAWFEWNFILNQIHRLQIGKKF